MFEPLRVLKTDSVQKLRRLVVSNPEITDDPLEDIADKHSLSFVPTVYNIDPSISLELPSGITQEQNRDSDNSSRILASLQNITPANATDERLWVTLCFGQYASYVRERWQFRNSQEDALSRHVLNHWFAAGIRGRMRDNGISRLWWMGYIASKVPGMSMEQVHDVLYSNSAYRSDLLERNNSSNSLNVLTAILKISQKAFDEGVPYNRQNWREFMKAVNFLGGRRNLAAMTQESLTELLRPVYEKAYSDTRANVVTKD